MSEFLLTVFKSAGWLFGPLMLLGGLVALVVCVRATVRGDRASALRALRWALVPPALGAIGACYGGSIWAFSGVVVADPARAWMALFCTIVFGVFAATPAALWATALLLRRPPAIA